MRTNVKHPLRLLRLTLCGLCLAWWAEPLQAQQAIRAFTTTEWQQLKQQAEQSPPLPTRPLAAYFSAGHFFPALPLQPLLSADGHWVYYWRRQGQQYWLCRSQGDGEEQVLHKQREVPPPQLILSRDQQQLWLAASDLLQLLDIRRKTLRTIWQPGFALPGIRPSPSRHSAQLIELNADGAVLQWQQASTSYWFLNYNHAARQIWPTPQRRAWQDSAGKVLFMQHAQEQESAQTAAETTSGLLPDISAQLRSADGKLLATARLYQRLYWHSEDPAWQTLLDQLQAFRPQCSMQLQSTALVTQKSAVPDKVKSAAFKLLVTYFCSDQTAAQHLLLTLDTDLQIRQRQPLQLSTTAPLPAGVSPQQVAWQAQDGHTIPGHLYLPPGRPLAQSPLVTQIHGGPFSRTDPSYDVLVQWLVNHGAIVLQVDYRSSAGYGPAFMQAAQGNFGPDNLLLGDIFSGLDLLLQNGIGNPAQQAVIGHSFGGYLTIQALQAQPQRFRFGLALAAPVDLAATLQAYVPTAATPFGEKSLSDLLHDAAVPWQDPHWQRQLSAASPRARIALLQRPLYLWAGGRDDRIAAATLQHFQQQALAQGKTVRLWLDPGSGHQTSTLQGRRLQFYLAASLLVSHLQSGPQPSFAPVVHTDTGNPQLDPLDDMLQTLEVRPAMTGN